MPFDFNRYRRDLYARTPITEKIATRERAAVKLLVRLGYRVSPPSDAVYSDCLAEYISGERR